MVECKELEYICQHVDKYSLVALDEIGQNTEREDGIALAAAFIDYLARKIGAIVICTTHNHELSKLSRQFSYINNYHMEVVIINNTLKFSHNLIKGPSSLSFCFHVAKLARIPNIIINYARKYKKILL